LHSTEYQNETTKSFDIFSITADSKILIDIAENKGPDKSLAILGYSGWGSGQLEGEMERDHWILSDPDIDIIFEKELNKKWPKAYKKSFIPL
jgi:putative transcriptional regulator